jgi:Mismatch repair ATPase (MutS family)
VLADIGDEQSLQQNLSTFSGHIRRIARILEALPAAGGASLVLLDEVGAGTDPLEGSALATALLKHLADRARLTIATTHFGELKALKYADPRFENASVAFDVDTLSPTYRLQWGIPGRSNALAIARRLGLGEPVLELAAAQLEPLGEGEVNQVIAGLENQRQRQQEAAERPPPCWRAPSCCTRSCCCAGNSRPSRAPSCRNSGASSWSARFVRGKTR